MRQLTLQIPDSKYSFFMELMHSFDFVDFSIAPDKSLFEADSEEDILQNISQGIAEIQLLKQGKLKTRSAKEFIHEL